MVPRRVLVKSQDEASRTLNVRCTSEAAEKQTSRDFRNVP
jgi:hypothetical protein